MDTSPQIVPPLTPFLHLLREKVGLSASLDDVAKTQILCAAESARIEPAIILDGQIERMRNFRSVAHRTRLMASLGGEIAHHGPTIAYTIAGAKLLAGSIFAGGARYRIRAFRESMPSPAPVDIERGCICTGLSGDLWFGHFLTEDLPQMLLAPEFGETIRLPSRDWAHLPVYRSLLELDWREVAAAQFGELTFFNDFAQNSLRQKRYRLLRSRLRRNLKAANPGAHVYLRRGATGQARAPLNDDEIAEALSRRGFVIVDIAQSDAMGLVACLLDAKIVVSVEGSNMIHAVYTIADDGGALVLMPPARPQIANKDRFDALGVPCAFVVGEDLGTDYQINIDELDRTLDLLERRIA